MALQQDGGPGPYGPPSGVIATVEAFRNRGLATPITADVLTRIGITDALAPRVLQSLRILDLIDEDGDPTEQMQVLRRAATEDYQTRFAEVVQNAYAPIFAFVDPATASLERIRDAFRPYEPVGQQGRMVTLFTGLLEHAGVIEPVPRRQAAARPRPGARRPSGDGGGRRPSPAGNRVQHGADAVIAPSPGLIFGVSNEDIAALNEDEFQEVWAALGKVARARSRGTPNPSEEDVSDDEAEGGEA